MEAHEQKSGEDFVVTIPRVCMQLGCSTSHLYRMIKAGDFPRPIRIGFGRVGVRQSVISAWIAQRG